MKKIDILSYISSSSEDVLKFNPDVFIIGAGMCGMQTANSLHKQNPELKFVILDKGDTFCQTHVANSKLLLPFESSNPILDSLPWDRSSWNGNVDFPGLIACFGGRGVFWGGWSPRLTEEDLALWHPLIAQYLRRHYSRFEEIMSVKPTAEFLAGLLLKKLKIASNSLIDEIPEIERISNGLLAINGDSILEAVKYSPIEETIRNLIADKIKANNTNGNASRRFLHLSNTEILKLITDSSGSIVALKVAVEGEVKDIAVKQGSQVVLASGTVDSTRLVLQSFPNNSLVGTNLMVHPRSDMVVRIRKDAISYPKNSQITEGATLHLQGSINQRRYHLQVTAAVKGDSRNENRAIDWLFGEPHIGLSDDDDYVVAILRVVTEMKGNRTKTPSTSWIGLGEKLDEYGYPKAFVHLKLSDEDREVWHKANHICLKAAQSIAQNPESIEYYFDGCWHKTLPLDWESQVKNGLGSSHHESATLFMGENPKTSVTDLFGKLHDSPNCWVVGSTVFPTVGSANPVLSTLVLSDRTALAVAKSIQDAGGSTGLAA